MAIKARKIANRRIFRKTKVSCSPNIKNQGG